jgi:hypothetical protein
MRRIICFILFILILSSFEIKPQGVSVFFKNSSAEDFKTLHVKIFGKDYFFENLKSGKTTKPINIEKTYRYCFAEVITSKDTLVFQPIDYVGETLHRGGKVTMDFYIFPEEGKERELWIR